MSKLSKYARQARRRSPLPVRRVFGIILVAAIGFVFCFGQLMLKFSVSDLERETRVLQSLRLDLQSRVNRTKSDVARLENGDRLIDRARQLGMVQYVVADVERVRIDPEIQERYALARANTGEGVTDEAESAEEFGRVIAMRLGFEQPAQARSN